MDPHGSIHREDTVVLLQRTLDAGPPVMIPGARDSTTRRAAVRMAAVAPPTPRSTVADTADSSQLARERDGGGSPSERSGPRPRTVLALLGGWFGRGIELLRPAAAFSRPGGGS